MPVGIPDSQILSDAEIVTAFTNQIAIASQGEAEAGTESDVRQFSPERIAQAIAALGGSGGGTLTAVKTSNETIQSDATENADADLFVNLEANKKYAFLIQIYLQSGTSPDFKYKLLYPSGSTGKQAYSYQIQDPQPTVDIQFGGNGNSDGNVQVVWDSGFIITDSTPGVLNVAWSQRTSIASDTTVFAGSFMLVWEL